jgi:hypothetical protein
MLSKPAVWFENLIHAPQGCECAWSDRVFFLDTFRLLLQYTSDWYASCLSVHVMTD